MDPVVAPWAEIALVCRKCSKKLDGGFGPKRRTKLAKAVKESLRASGRRRALRVIEVECLGLCPKQAVTVATSVRPGVLYAVPGGADLDEVVRTLSARGAPAAA